MLRNTAWHRLGLRVVCAGVVRGLLIFVLPVVFLPFLVSVSPLRAALGGDQDQGKDKRSPQPLAVRWAEEQPGCTFSRGDDGKYRYGLWSGDAGITLAVDAREVQVIQHRNWPIFGVLLTIRYRGVESLDASPNGITLQFMKHFKV